MDRIAKDVKATLATIPGTLNISTSRKLLPLEFRLSFDSAKLQLHNLTLPQVAMFAKNATDGIESTTIYR